LSPFNTAAICIGGRVSEQALNMKKYGSFKNGTCDFKNWKFLSDLMVKPVVLAVKMWLW